MQERDLVLMHEWLQHLHVRFRVVGELVDPEDGKPHVLVRRDR